MLAFHVMAIMPPEMIEQTVIAAISDALCLQRPFTRKSVSSSLPIESSSAMNLLFPLDRSDYYSI